MVQEKVTLQEELRTSTSKAHQNLEKKLTKRIKNIKSTGDYLKFLKMMYGYYSPLEKELDRYTPYVQMGNRRMSYRLLNDINTLESGKKIEVCRDLPSIDSLASALGAMYVTEGSVLGASHIADMLIAQLQLKDNTSLSFFTGLGDIGANWKAFQSNFIRDFEDDERRSIIRTATTTFETFSHWIEKNS